MGFKGVKIIQACFRDDLKEHLSASPQQNIAQQQTLFHIVNTLRGILLLPLSPKHMHTNMHTCIDTHTHTHTHTCTHTHTHKKKKKSLTCSKMHFSKTYFVCVEVLRPNQPNGVMSSAVSLPNHTFTGQAKSSKQLTSIVHILSPGTDNCPSWISGRERMTVENISWSISTKECCRPWRGLNPRPPGLQSDGASNWATEVGSPKT